MISNLLLKFGRAPGVPAESIPLSPMTVFVGPNNSGKSKVLKEIEGLCRSGRKDPAAVILEGLTFSGLTESRAHEAVEHLRQSPNEGEALQPGYIMIGSRYGRQPVPFDNLIQSIQDPTSHLAGVVVHSPVLKVADEATIPSS